jgi:tetratricopeptide (TPR) repeat protein
MKKSIVVIALLLASFTGVLAQDMKVQSAYSDMKNERLAYAKKNIDDALVHEKTKDDSKTFAYAGLIYAQIVEQSFNDKPSKTVKKQLKQIEEPIETICHQGVEYLMKAIEMEQKENSHEYTKMAMDGLKYLCGVEAYYAGEFYNKATDYQVAAQKWDKVIELAKYCHYDDVLDNALYYQADCYRMLKNTKKELEIYRTMAKNNTKRPDVYVKIYAANKEANDTTKALNALKKGVRMTANDTTGANTILTTELISAYLWANNKTEANKLLQEMEQKAGQNTDMLNGVGRIYGEMGDMTKATEYYNKSLSINKNQIDVYKGMGKMFFNVGLREHKVADAIPLENVTEYDNKMKEVYVLYEKAIPCYENALQMKDTDLESLNQLRLIYSIFNARTDVNAETKKAYQQKFVTYDTKLKQLTTK